jgi:hypothetical protein
MLSDNDMKRKLTLWIVLVLMLAGIFIIAFHHHDDDCDHNDCPICIAAHQVASAIADFFPLAVFCVFITRVVAEQKLFFPLVRYSFFSSRAPPACVL